MDEVESTPGLKAYFHVQKLTQLPPSRKFSRLLSEFTGSETERVIPSKTPSFPRLRRYQNQRISSIRRLSSNSKRLNTPAVGTYDPLHPSHSHPSFTISKRSSTPLPGHVTQRTEYMHSTPSPLSPYYTYKIKPKPTIKPRKSTPEVLHSNDFRSLDSSESLSVLRKSQDLSLQIHSLRSKLHAYRLPSQRNSKLEL